MKLVYNFVLNFRSAKTVSQSLICPVAVHHLLSPPNSSDFSFSATTPYHPPHPPPPWCSRTQIPLPVNYNVWYKRAKKVPPKPPEAPPAPLPTPTPADTKPSCAGHSRKTDRANMETNANSHTASKSSEPSTDTQSTRQICAELTIQLAFVLMDPDAISSTIWTRPNPKPTATLLHLHHPAQTTLRLHLPPTPIALHLECLHCRCSHPNA